MNKTIKKVLLFGSGALIGEAGEYDCAASQALTDMKKQRISRSNLSEHHCATNPERSYR